MKHILKSSKEIIITYILTYLITIISALIYYILGYDYVDHFLNNICPYILIPFYILTIIYLYKKNHKQETSLSKKQYFPLILLGLSIAIFLNMIIFKFYPPQSIIKPNFITIISTSLIGPIYEEILFRYLLYNRLKTKYPIKKAILITTIIFSLIHLSPIKIIYAFLLGLVLNICYEKYNNILAPILIHISANLIANFLFEYNTYILILSLISLLLGIYLNFKNTCRKKINIV